MRTCSQSGNLILANTVCRPPSPARNPPFPTLPFLPQTPYTPHSPLCFVLLIQRMMPPPFHLPPHSHRSTPSSPLTPRLPMEPCTWARCSHISDSFGGQPWRAFESVRPPKDFSPQSHQNIMNPPLKLQMTILLHLLCLSYRKKGCFYKTWRSFPLLTSTQQNGLLQHSCVFHICTLEWVLNVNSNMSLCLYTSIHCYLFLGWPHLFLHGMLSLEMGAVVRGEENIEFSSLSLYLLPRPLPLIKSECLKVCLTKLNFQYIGHSNAHIVHLNSAWNV